MKRVSCPRLPHSAGPEPTYTMRYVASELGNQRMAQTGHDLAALKTWETGAPIIQMHLAE